MFNSNRPEPDLLKTVLEPLLDDFQYWFSRSRTLLETENLSFLSDEEHADLLERVIQTQQEVNTVQALLKATDGQAGVDTSILVTWHHLVSECWQVSMKLRSQKSP
ncbi:MAG: DUF2605 domain-containing protein [Plectolyngbya sp. WJT66-NPBG17]|jgi:hypothetical protein|nr:DUF2605 domain-containing protein [Plectolyngbya sp. WJT66-NPBG17]MBW4523953.1 DUF2605 domain-containing protein [Phormidium tanganyikae FI6-MK23]